MPITIVATAGAANANSYVTVDEANAYFETRVPLSPVWPTTGEPAKAALVMATRLLDAMAVARKVLRLDSRNGGRPYYVTSKAWTGVVATTTQALAWPRTGMYDRLGRAVASTVIPSELKEAQSELAGHLLIADRTLENEVAAQGITSIKAGSVALTFKEMIETAVFPDAVWNLMPPSWFTDEIVTGTRQLVFRAL